MKAEKLDRINGCFELKSKDEVPGDLKKEIDAAVKADFSEQFEDLGGQKAADMAWICLREESVGEGCESLVNARAIIALEMDMTHETSG